MIQIAKGRSGLKATIEKYLPTELKRELEEIENFENAEELRIRAEQPAMLYACGKETILQYVPDMPAVRKMTFALSEHSMTAFYEELRQGFFTIGKGIRIGVAGRVVCENGGVRMIRDYSALNIRFPREFPKISRPIAGYLRERGQILSTLIISAPQQGKTTLLRDLIRAVSDGDEYEPNKCSVIDERSEISGGMNFNLGKRTDVLLGCPKAVGMRMALRALSPNVIATDEIGGEADLEMLFDASVSGVKVIATAHAASREELMQRMFFRKLCQKGVIERIVLLSDALGRGTVSQIYDRSGELLLKVPISIRGESGCD